MSNEADLFAPPSKEEIALAMSTPQPPPGNQASDPLFAPPSADELKQAAAPVDEGALAAAGSGLAHGLTFQMYDKLKAAAQAANDKYQGTGDFGPQYDKRLADQKAAVAKLADQHPYAYHGAEISGAIVNPLNALIPGSGLVGNVAAGAGVGAIQAAAESNAHPLESYDQAKKFGGDLLTGAEYGALGGGIGTGISKGISAIPGLAKKASTVLLGAPATSVERYIANPESVMTSPGVVDTVGNVKNQLGQLKNQIGSDSQASRQILDDSQKYTGADIANFFASKINDIKDRAQGVLNPEEQATVSQLNKYLDTFQGAEDASFSGSKIKDLIQNIDRNVKYGKMPGQFDAPDERVLKSLRGQFNDQLRTDTPAYADAMDELAKKSAVLNQAQGLFKSDQGLANTLERVRRDRAPFAADALNNLDQQFGTNTIEQLKDALARESFDKAAAGPGGSHNVQKYAHMAEAALGGGTPGIISRGLGALSGATVDRYGPSIAKKGIDAYLGAKDFTMNPTVQSYLQAIQNGAQSTQMSPNINPAVSQYLINKYFGNTP